MWQSGFPYNGLNKKTFICVTAKSRERDGREKGRQVVSIIGIMQGARSRTESTFKIPKSNFIRISWHTHSPVLLLGSSRLWP